MTLEQKLLVTREPLRLEMTKGIVEVHQTVPEFLRETPLLVDPVFSNRFSKVNLVALLPPGKSFLSPEEAYHAPYDHILFSQKSITAYWSGGRSCLVEDQEGGRLFRLKGIAFDECLPQEDPALKRVFGGQFLQSAKYEIAFANRFNRILAEEGIPPTMQYRGRYKYPHILSDGSKMAATIFEVAGDTRVDELISQIELQIIFCLQGLFRLQGYAVSTSPYLEVEEAVKELYQNLGFVSGRLKKLMDRNGMTWGDSPQNTNAHHGNLVIYPADKKHFAVGLVDFDASCDKSEFSPPQLRIQQHCEKSEFTGNHLPEKVLSQRIQSSYSLAPCLINLRKQFRKGFKEGYACSLHQQITHLIDKEPYDTLISALKNLS